MATIVTRSGKGSALSHTEMDSNIQNLNADKLENVSEDTTPQLGGNLDVNGNDIVSTSNGDIDIIPNGTGNVKLGNFTFDADQTVGSGQDDYVLTYDHSTTSIKLEAAASTGLSNVVEDTTPQLGGDLDVNSNSLVSTSNGDITLTPNGTGNVVLGNYEFDVDQTVGASQDNFVLTYNNSTGHISLEASFFCVFSDVVDDTTPQLGGNLDVNNFTITDSLNNEIKFNKNIQLRGTRNIFFEEGSTGNGVKLQAPTSVTGTPTFTLPASDGTSGQVLQTNGSGVLSFTTVSGGGGGDVVDDTTPQLGGNLDINGFDIVSAQTNQPIKISPSGTGAIELDTSTVEFTDDDSAVRGTLAVFGNPTFDNFQNASSHRYGFVSRNIRNRSMNANGRMYGNAQVTDLTFDNENTTTASGDARNRNNWTASLIDLNGMTYGALSDNNLNRFGRGIIGSYNTIDIMNTNTSYEGTTGRVSAMDTEVNCWVGYDKNEQNVSGCQDLNIDRLTVYTGRIGSNASSPSSNGVINISDHSAVWHTHKDSRDGNRNDILWASGANAFNMKNDKPHYAEKFGSVKHYSELAYEATHSTSGTFTVDYDNGNSQIITLEDNITSFTMSNFPGDNQFSGTPMIGAVTLYLKQDGTGSRTVSFTAGASETFKIANGITTVDSGAGNYTVVHVQNVDGTYLWTISGNYT